MRSITGAFVTTLVILLGSSTCLAQLTCDQAITYHEYALQELGTCMDPATQNTSLCQLVSQSQQQAPSGFSISLDQLQLVSDPTSTIEPWQNYLVQGVMTQVADLGEISYILNSVQAAYTNLSAMGTSSITNDAYYAAWQEPWFAQADANMDIAANTQYNSEGFTLLDYIGISETYWKAANYYFAGFWPFPFSQESIERAADSVTAFYAGLDQNPLLLSLNFSVPFNNGSATAELPAIFISPDTSKALPLIIITGGTDYPKEMNVLQFGLQAIKRGFAIVVYDGPGQGQVIRNPPYMPFYPEWDEVFEAILDGVFENFPGLFDPDAIIHQGVSLGGYLSSRACSKTSDRVAACTPNPPISDVASTYQKLPVGLAQSIYGGLAFAGQQNASLMPAGYAQAFQNATGIVNTLLLTCNASSGAPGLISDMLASSQGPMDPELVYLAGAYGGVLSGDPEELATGLWHAFRSSQKFGAYDISNISVPVIGVKGTEDNLFGGQENDFFAALSPSTSDASTLITFDTASGGSLHDQVGSPYLLAARLFGALAAIVNPLESNMNSTATLVN